MKSVELVEREINEGRAMLDARVVDEDVDGAEPLLDPPNFVYDRLAIGNVGDVRIETGESLALEGPRGRFRPRPRSRPLTTTVAPLFARPRASA